MAGITSFANGLPVADLLKLRDPRNPRIMPADEHAALVKSLKRFGVVDPIIVNTTTNQIVGGHQRLEVAAELGFEKVPVAYIEVSAEEQAQLNIALNRIGGVWDDEKLKVLLTEIDELNLDLQLTGFTADEVAALLDPANLPEMPTITDDGDKTDKVDDEKPSLLEGVTVESASDRISFKCTDGLLLLKDLDSDSVDMVMTSPPYDAIRDYDGFEVDLPGIGQEISRVLKPGGVAVVVIQDQTKDGHKSLSSFKLAVDWCASGVLGLFECLIYHRNGVPGNWWKQRFRVDHEYIHVFVKGSKPNFFDKDHMLIATKCEGEASGGTITNTAGEHIPMGFTVGSTKCPGTVLPYLVSPLEAGQPQADKALKALHPAPYPNKLASDFIRCFCPVDGLVVDPMMGSGTTLIQAAIAGRYGLGSDLSEKYCKIVAKRSQNIQDEV